MPRDSGVLGAAIPEPERDLDSLGGDPEAHDAAASLELDAVEHQRREAQVAQRAAHQRAQLLAGPAHELAADRRLARRALTVEHLLADRLARALEAPRRDARQHLLKHDRRQRIAIGEVRIGSQLDLARAIDRPRARPLDRHPSPAERDLTGLVSVADRRAIEVMATLRADHRLDLLGHQLAQHTQPHADAQGQQPFLRRASQLAQRFLHPRRQRVELLLADQLVGLVVYVPHGGSPVSMDLFALATLPTAADEAGEPPPQVLRATGQPRKGPRQIS